MKMVHHEADKFYDSPLQLSDHRLIRLTQRKQELANQLVISQFDYRDK